MMKVNLNWKPRTLGEHVVFYSFCLLLVSPIWFHSRVFIDVTTAVAALIVVVVAGMILMRRGAC
jgi:CHASE2 domain-containing sensor protein